MCVLVAVNAVAIQFETVLGGRLIVPVLFGLEHVSSSGGEALVQLDVSVENGHDCKDGEQVSHEFSNV